jgi:predicted ATPase
MEEIYQVLLDERALTRNGVTRLIKPIGELKIPSTVQGTLAARIDRLPADAKDLLQTLSVIGRQFPMSLVRAVVPKSDDELETMLNGLQLGEFVYEQPAVGDTEFIFKHALTQEVSYNSVLQERRKLMHQRIGAAVEVLYADRIEDHPANLHVAMRAALTRRRRWSIACALADNAWSGRRMLMRSPTLRPGSRACRSFRTTVGVRSSN